MDIINIAKAVAVLGLMGGGFGLVLAIASKVFAVKTDPRLPEILDCLAGANCGGCGYPGCGGCAEAILNGKAPVNACPPAGAENAAKIAAIMGVEAVTGARMVAAVKCGGGNRAVKKFEYRGVEDCLGALKVGAGPLECSYGCLGFGTCVRACKFDAIAINANGVAVVDADKCTNCMACATACPRQLIFSKPAASPIEVLCASKDKGIVAKNACELSCIACKLCEKNCPAGAIVVTDNIAVIDYAKCTSCGACVLKCPRKLIVDVDGKFVPTAPVAKPAAPAAAKPTTPAAEKPAAPAPAPTPLAAPAAEGEEAVTKE